MNGLCLFHKFDSNISQNIFEDGIVGLHTNPAQNATEFGLWQHLHTLARLHLMIGLTRLRIQGFKLVQIVSKLYTLYFIRVFL